MFKVGDKVIVSGVLEKTVSEVIGKNKLRVIAGEPSADQLTLWKTKPAAGEFKFIPGIVVPISAVCQA